MMLNLGQNRVVVKGLFGSRVDANAIRSFVPAEPRLRSLPSVARSPTVSLSRHCSLQLQRV